ncbi:hypothetical protein [Sphingobium sp. BS19]|uniref:hypothetical protein n=1 Tax=Sphingobium sp. BS19 TaxID=3018973 RepID=UPI0024916C1C|nr:hypothetical protein [Sphingobium sp. BS19]
MGQFLQDSKIDGIQRYCDGIRQYFLQSRVISVSIYEYLHQNHNGRKARAAVFHAVSGQVEEIAGKFVRLIRKQYFQLQSDDEHAMSGGEYSPARKQETQ